MVLEDIYAPSKNPPDLSGIRGFDAKLASPVDRLAASVADLVIFMPLLLLIIAPFGRLAKDAQLVGQDELWLSYVAAAIGCGALALVLYQTIFVFMWGATPGKLVLRLRVVSIWTSMAPTPLEAFLRSLMTCFEILLLGVPWLAVFSNERRRSFHDRIADTAVISLTSRRRVGLAGLAEMSIASGFQMAVLAVAVLILAVNVAQYRLHHEATNEAVAVREEDGRLCSEIREAIDGMPGRKVDSVSDRLQTALALFSAEELDRDCLDAEAEFALWKNEERPLAYLAKGLASHHTDRADGYLQTACERARESGDEDKLAAEEICGMADLASDDETSDLNAEDSSEEKLARRDRDERIEQIVSAVDAKNSLFMRIAALRRAMSSHNAERVLHLVDGGWAAPHKLAAFIAKARAKALWQVGDVRDARTTFRATAQLVDSKSRLELARWFCVNDTLTSGCTTEARASCDVLSDAVDHYEPWLLKPEVAAAYIRGQACAVSGDAEQWRELERKIPSPDGKAYVRALSEIESGDRAAGIASLKTLAAPPSVFSFEAGARLAELAGDLEELKIAQKAWESLDADEEPWQPFGRLLLRKLNGFHAWDKSLALGLKLVQSDPGDRRSFELMVVAANGLGQRKLALGFLENAVRIGQREIPPTRFSAKQRLPASEDFADVARQLLRDVAPQIRSKAQSEDR